MAGRYEQQLDRAVAAARIERGLSDESKEEVALILHVMNAHGIDFGGARERVGPLKGLPATAWWLDDVDGVLTVYQVVLGDDRKAIASALARLATTLERAAIACKGEDVALIEDRPLRALGRALRVDGRSLQDVHAVLLTMATDDVVEQMAAFEQAQSRLARSDWSSTRGSGAILAHGRVALRRGADYRPSFYGLRGSLAGPMIVEDETELWTGLVHLEDLVGLFDARGPSIFDKNVRYTLTGKDSQTRVAGPMRASLGRVASGELPPSYFTAYHVGVTLVATHCERAEDDAVQLENPCVINGCQSISTAHTFWGQRHRANDVAGLERLGQVTVLAKVVVRPTEEHSHEISNSNNRQNPIESWQLFCNDPIHIQLEAALRGIDIFYERQKGRYANLKPVGFDRSNKTFITPMDLGAAVTLAVGDLKHAAHPRKIFDDKATHDALFTKRVGERPLSCLLAVNGARSVRHGLKKYTEGGYYDDARLRLSAHPDARSLLHHIAFRALVRDLDETGHQLTGRLYKRASPSSSEWTSRIFRQTVKRVVDVIREEGKWTVARRDSLCAELLDKLRLSGPELALFERDDSAERQLTSLANNDALSDLLDAEG
jgi:hypothetical protein